MRRGSRGPGGAGRWGRLLLVELLAVSVLLVPLLALGASPAAADTGPWGWPLAGPPVLDRDFAPPASRYGSGHRGVDLVGVPGGAVSAAGAGRVSYAGMLAGRGVVVVVHGALRTTYEPVSAVVSVGDVVGVGEQVGLLEAGHAGCPSPACLHWGLRRGEAYLDPIGLVERRPARLLPLEPGTGADASTSGAPSGVPATASRGDGSPVGVPLAAGPRERTLWDATTSAPSDPAVGDGRSPESTVVQEPVRLAARGQTDAALGLLAAAALVAGVALLSGRRPEPSGPAAVAAPGPVTPDDLEGPGQAPVLELATERLRRRSTS